MYTVTDKVRASREAMTQVARNESLIRMRDSNPEAYTFAKLGRIFHITRQDAHSIYKRAKEVTK